MEGRGKGAEGAAKKRRRIAAISLPGKDRSGTGSISRGSPEVIISDVVTVVTAGRDLPQGIPSVATTGEVPPKDVISLDVEATDGGLPPTYYARPSDTRFDPTQSPITPENGVEFLCSYGKNMLRSSESNVFGKMSTVDRIRQSTGNIWQALGTLLDIEKKFGKVKDVNSKLYDKIKRDRGQVEAYAEKFKEASSSYRRSKGECRRKHSKLLDYRRKLRRANKTIATLKRDLGENAIDRYMISDDGYDRDKEIFDSAVEDLKEMLGSTYLDFDFSEFNSKVAAAQEARTKPVSDPVEDLSLKFLEEYLSDDDPTDVSEDDARFSEGAARRVPARGRAQ